MNTHPLAHFHARIQEKAQAVSAPPVLIVAFGDSVTQGFTKADTLEPRAVFHQRLKEGLEGTYPLTTFSVLNAGVARETAQEGLGRLERDVTRHQPDLVLIAFGLNDAAGLGRAVGGLAGIPAFKQALQFMIGSIRAQTDSDVILLTPNLMLTMDDPHVDASDRAIALELLALQQQGVVAAYAEAIREVAHVCGVLIADVYRTWEEMGAAGRDTNMLLANGLNHPSAEAHAITAELILQLVTESSRATQKLTETERVKAISSHLKAGGAPLPNVLATELPTISYVTFRSLDPQAPLTIAGQLRVPANNQGAAAAVVLVHGSAGVDSRGRLYAEALNRAGIATLEVDLWAARGWIGSHRGRPEGVPETLPDAYGALRWLASLPDVDETRIGIMGFSWGGSVTMLTATRPYTRRYCPDQLRFAAHAAFYPVCWAYNTVPGYEFRDLTGAPVLIQAGELDTYDAPDAARILVENLPKEAQDLVSLEVYPGATHAFNRLEPAITINDPFSHQGRGGEVAFTPNLEATAALLEKTVQFFRRSLGALPGAGSCGYQSPSGG